MSKNFMFNARQLVDRYASIGLDGLPDTEKSKRFAFNILVLIGFVTVVGYGAFYALYDFEGLRIAWTASLVCTSIVILPIMATHSLRLALYLGVALTIWVFTFLSYHLGAGTGLYLFLNVPLIAVTVVNGKENLADTLVFWIATTSAMVTSAVFFQNPSGAARVDPAFQEIVLVGVVIGLAAMIGAGVLALSFRVARAEAALAREHARSEALLGNLLPTEIAARLKLSPGVVIADGLPEVTILFADIVNFTPRASSMQPEDLVNFLNRVFTEFDSLTEQFGLEKIKTIGDAYMVAAGMPTARADHAQIVADMALAMLDVTARLTAETGQYTEVRIGLHSGAAVAGVIGTQKVFYDVWGDTVNTASRMESQGEEGRIQITQDMKDRLGATYTFEPRGIVEIKGKGLIQTYWLTGKG
ncbi:MAG: adenylate/guanylate cyclase domain-containing protein [Hyphomicrobiales bacterium]|nr:adenylate/guanylate cyclase domain-containing protein [Hyphomicrobiales bacterium]